MPQSFSSLHTHIIFSTKLRQPFLTPDLTERLYPYMGGLVRNRKSTLVRIGGFTDHVHLLVRLARDVSVSELVGAVKSNSSVWIHETFPERKSFSWQQGYAAFAVSLSSVDDVAKYIERQEEHHRVKSFQDEYREFLRKHEVEFDERYMWD
jgi:putative transposase